jgi:hypothetical protein
MQDLNTLTIEKIGTIVIPGHVPSINDYIKEANRNHFAGGKFESEWKQVGNAGGQAMVLDEVWDYNFVPAGTNLRCLGGQSSLPG